MADGVSFERLCSLFARSLLVQAHAIRSEQLSKFQRSRLAEAMTAEIRKLGDMAVPAARAPKISRAAKDLAESLGHDLSQQTWHSQKKLDGYQTFTYEHFYTVRDIRLELTRQSTTKDVMDVLHRMLWIAWITKEEDQRLHALGFGTVRPDPLLAYRQAEIELLPDANPIPRAFPGVPPCASCGEREAVWLVTGADHSGAPGRVLAYCSTCRRDKAADLDVAIPLDVVFDDPDGILNILYAAGPPRLWRRSPRP